MAEPITFTLPLIGTLTFQELTLPAIVIGGAIDSINPCAFGVLIFLMAYLTKIFENRNRALLGGLMYTTSVYITYFLAGVGLLGALRSTNPILFFGLFAGSIVLGVLLHFLGKGRSSFGFDLSKVSYWFYGISVFLFILGIIATVPQTIASYSFYWVAIFIAFGAAAFEIKDFLWYGKGLSLQLVPGSADRIKMWTSRVEEVSEESPNTALLMTIPIGFGAAAFELPCTGQVYFVIINLINASGVGVGEWLPLLALYNLIFVLPLLLITGLMYFGMSSERLEIWRKKNRRHMRLLAGLFLYALGAFLLWFTFRQFAAQPTIRPLTFLLFLSQVIVIGYVVYKGYFETSGSSQGSGNAREEDEEDEDSEHEEEDAEGVAEDEGDSVDREADARND